MLLAESLTGRTGAAFLTQQGAMLEAFGATAAVRAQVLEYARQKTDSIRELADALGAPDDEQELYRSTGFLWLELKSEWVRYNQTMQYQVARDGEADPVVFTKGAVCAGLIGAIEGLLMPQDLDKLDALSMEPLSIGKDVENIDRFLSHCEQQLARIARIFASASGAAEGISTLRALSSGGLGDLTSRYELVLAELARETDTVLQVDFDFIWPVLVEGVEAAASQATLRAQLMRDEAASGKVDLRTVRTLGRLTRAAGLLLLEHGSDSAQARLDEGKPPHHTVKAQVTGDGARTVLRLVDDGHGQLAARCAAAGPAREAWLALERELQALGATAQLASAPGGSEVTVTLELAGLASGESFLHLSGVSPALCVPAQRVSDGLVEVTAADTVLDLRKDRSGAPTLCRVTLASGTRAVLLGTGAPLSVRGIAVPTGALDAPAAATFALSILTTSGVVGLLDERALRALIAISPPAAVRA